MPSKTARRRVRRDALVEYRGKRDFSKTSEPRGERAHPRKHALAFVIQKHAASHLHFDVRLELDGVMKSWAVPKGPSRDPSVKRLAMHVEDHPIDYNSFEGTIPKGEYGGGTVMIWDRGTYGAPDGDDDALRAGYESGRLRFVLDGERLQGQWALARMKSKDNKQWLLIKHGDEFVHVGDEFAKSDDTSVVTGRTMAEIAAAEGDARDVAASKVLTKTQQAMPPRREAPSRSRSRSRTRTRVLNTAAIRQSAPTPMLASVGTELPRGPDWAFEPKYDGVRVLAFVSDESVALVSRNGIDKAPQFPEIVEALQTLAAKHERPFVIDGEIVARVGRSFGRFQALQDRIGQTNQHTIASHARNRATTLVAFDILLDGADAVANEEWTDRRQSLEALLEENEAPALSLAESSRSGARLLARAKRAHWEGVMAKRIHSTYTPGVRSRDWLKLKIEARQEFVVGGWTEPRRSRQHLGALLVGYYENGVLRYAGHVGGGFSRDSLASMYKRLESLEQDACPFDEEPRTNEVVHWTRPEVIVEVKFNEWTSDGKLRQPVFLGVRDDKDPRSITREPPSVEPDTDRAAPRRRRTGTRTGKKSSNGKRTATSVSAQLSALEDDGVDGEVKIEKGRTLAVTNLRKVYFPAVGRTKGDAMRYYDAVSPYLLPLIADRPLVLKRYPDGVSGPAFFQQNADDVPDGVRIETVPAEGSPGNRIIGGDLQTLLYCVQLGAIDVNPWHSRVGSLQTPDYTILDLDPGPKATFATIVQVAGALKEFLDEAGVSAALKTSGSRGLHIVIPLVPNTSEDTAQLVARIFAQRAANALPKLATVVRMRGKRPPATVYVDYLQNVVGKSVACAFSIRPRPNATVSTPLDWDELTPKLDPARFTMDTVVADAESRGRMWHRAMRQRNAPSRLLQRA